MTQAEFDSMAYPAPVIKLCSGSAEVFTYHAANGKHFTVRELLAAIEDAERKSRGNTEFLDGIDVHHIYYEGLCSADEEDEDFDDDEDEDQETLESSETLKDVWMICWGS